MSTAFKEECTYPGLHLVSSSAIELNQHLYTQIRNQNLIKITFIPNEHSLPFCIDSTTKQQAVLATEVKGKPHSFEGCKNNCILLWTHLSNHFHFNTTCPFIRLGSFLYDTKHKNPQIYAKLTRNKDNDNRMLTALRTLLVAIRALYNTLISLLL